MTTHNVGVFKSWADEAERLARQTLLDCGLFWTPVDPIAVAARLGIDVYNAKFSEEHLAAIFSRRACGARILISESDSPYRRRFSIGHDIGHFVLHRNIDDVEDHDSEMLMEMTDEDGNVLPELRREIEANQFAEALLMPKELVRREWQKNRSIAVLAQRFNVPEEVMEKRVNALMQAVDW